MSFSYNFAYTTEELLGANWTTVLETKFEYIVVLNYYYVIILNMIFMFCFNVILYTNDLLILDLILYYLINKINIILIFVNYTFNF